MINVSKRMFKNTEWFLADNVWHSVVEGRKVCDKCCVVGDVFGEDVIDDVGRICADCWNTLKISKVGIGEDDIRFNVKVFGNENILKILRGLRGKRKKAADFHWLLKGTRKSHLNFEFKKLLYNELIERDGLYYGLTPRGTIACNIADYILKLRDMSDEDIIKEVDRYGK